VNARNVTLSLPDDVLRTARHLAVDRGVSLSRLVSELIQGQAGGESGYESAMKRQKALMRRGLDLGFKGKVPWSRGELHDR